MHNYGNRLSGNDNNQIYSLAVIIHKHLTAECQSESSVPESRVIKATTVAC